MAKLASVEAKLSSDISRLMLLALRLVSLGVVFATRPLVTALRACFFGVALRGVAGLDLVRVGAMLVVVCRPMILASFEMHVCLTRLLSLQKVVTCCFLLDSITDSEP